MSFRIYILVLLFHFVSNSILAQNITNVRAEMEGDIVRIRYDLVAPDDDQLFTVEVYSSHDNFSEPLEYVRGDVGKGIKPGTGYEIIWQAQEELVDFRGEITFEIWATVIGGYYRITNPTSSSSFKPGKQMSINWVGGSSNEKVQIDLMRMGSKVVTINNNMNNQGSFVWTIPKNIKAGRGYQIEITNLDDPDKTGTSKAFKIKKFPMIVVIIAGAAVLGGAAALLLSGDDGTTDPGGNGGNGTLEDLPPPIDPESVLLELK